MTDIAALLANAADTKANFDFGNLNKNYWEGRDQYAKNDLRDAFRGGVPIGSDGQPDFASMAKTLFQKGGLDQGVLAAKLGLEQQNQQFGQGQSRGISAVEGGSAPPNISPSMSRQASTQDIAPRNQGGQTSQVAPQGGGQPKTVMELAMAKGLDNFAAGKLSQRLIGSDGIGPHGEIDFSNPQARNLVTSALQYELKNNGNAAQPNQSNAPMPQAQPQVAQQQAPMVPTPVQTQAIRPQAAPAPVTNALTSTGAPPTPSRTDQMIAFYAGIMSDPRSPKQNVELAKTRLEALQKSQETTSDQKNFVQWKLDGNKGSFDDFLNRADDNTTQRDILTKSIIPRIDKSQETAVAARDDIDAIHRARTELDKKGGVFSGAYADKKLLFAKVAESLGVPNADKIANTEAYGAAIGSRVASMVKAFGSGTAISDGDRRFAAAMAGGQVTLDEKSMRRILDIGEQAARGKINYHNEFVGKAVDANEGLKPARQSFVVKAPEDYNAPLSKAKRAIEAGAPRDAVIKRLRDAGHNPAGL